LDCDLEWRQKRKLRELLRNPRAARGFRSTGQLEKGIAADRPTTERLLVSIGARSPKFRKSRLSICVKGVWPARCAYPTTPRPSHGGQSFSSNAATACTGLGRLLEGLRLGNAWRALAVPHGTSGTKSPYGTPGDLERKALSRCPAHGDRCR
jgi:hypothetical protein